MSLTDASQAAVGAALTVLILTIALVAPLVYVAFYATNYTFFQKIVVVLVSLILAVSAAGGIWSLLGGGKGINWLWSPTAKPGEGKKGVRGLGPSFLSGLGFSFPLGAGCWSG